MSATLQNTVQYTSNVFSCCSRGLGFTIIVFLTTQYFKKKSNHRSAYYTILNVGYAVDFVLFVNWVIPIPFMTYTIMSIMLEWYIAFFTTIWNFVLCLNRCSALALFARYDRIWRPFNMFLVVIFMIAFPFIIDVSAFIDSKCYTFRFTSNSCLSFRTFYYLKATIFNAALNSIGFLLIFISIFKSSHDTLRSNSTHAKTERRLIYQAIFSSILQLASFGIKYFTASSPREMYFTWMFFADIVYHFQHLVIMISHFVLSPTFKIAYFEFYRLKFLLPKQSTIAVSHRSNTNNNVKPFVSSTMSAVM